MVYSAPANRGTLIALKLYQTTGGSTYPRSHHPQFSQLNTSAGQPKCFIMKNAIEKAQKEIKLLKTEAKSSRNKLRSFFESSSTIHLLIDTKLRLIDFNRAAVNFIKNNHNLTIVAGSMVTDFLHKDHMRSFKSNYQKALNGTPIRTQQELEYQNQTITWFISYEPAWDCDGNILGISFNAIDVTEKLANERKIISQHHSLQEIAYIQSHQLRRPVCNIVGLMKLFTANGGKLNKAGFCMLQRAVHDLESEMVLIEKFAAPETTPIPTAFRM